MRNLFISILAAATAILVTPAYAHTDRTTIFGDSVVSLTSTTPVWAVADNVSRNYLLIQNQGNAANTGHIKVKFDTIQTGYGYSVVSGSQIEFGRAPTNRVFIECSSCSVNSPVSVRVISGRLFDGQN
jgi:hypothetical protein